MNGPFCITPRKMKELISQHLPDMLEDDKEEMLEAAERSETLIAGMYEGKLLCILGFVRGSLISDTAYAWLLTTDAALDHPVVYGRYTKRVLERVKQTYPHLVGICMKENKLSKTWLERLGAKVVDHTPLSWRFEL